MRKITTIERAMEQFAYRLQNGRYEPNQNDVDAFKFVAEWINREKAKEINQNFKFLIILKKSIFEVGYFIILSFTWIVFIIFKKL